MSVMANISSITRTSLHDGPGVRTVVYFKGCGLRCQWCHNPETLSFKKDVLYTATKCIHCGSCVAACDCHQIRGNDMVFLRETCKGCGKCADLCPTGALSVSGTAWTVDDLMKELRKDLHYYHQSNGGVTLSGGECLMQAEFCAQLLARCKQENIHTLIETALFVPWAQVEKVLPACDQYYTDFKIPDPEKHRRYTGQSNELILENLKKLVAAVPNRVTVRIPLIPGVNDSPDDIVGFSKALAPIAEAISGLEVLRYNTLAESKYLQLDQTYRDFGETQTEGFLTQYVQALQRAFDGTVNVYTVI